MVRSFHAPSGNVSCQVLPSEATCSVASINESFVLPAGESGRIEQGLRLPAGSGGLAPYGSTVAVGSVVCEVPPSDVPRGISCYDSHSGHGFEASRIVGRQKTY
jgi:hypothetical protein